MIDVNIDLKPLSTTKICEIVISSRYLGLDEKLIVRSMQELSRRRMQDGDEFLFENYIEEKLQELPVLDFKVPDLKEIMDTIQSVSKGFKK